MGAPRDAVPVTVLADVGPLLVDPLEEELLPLEQPNAKRVPQIRRHRHRVRFISNHLGLGFL